MTSKEITELPLGTKVFLINDAKIESWITLAFNPNYPFYFYLWGNGSVTKTKCLFLDFEANHGDKNLIWETDYEKAKEIMWKQLKRKVMAINEIYMSGEEDLNFNT
jgi:hypothetical protein